MDEKERHSAFMSALVTEHYVLQANAGATVSEASARASLYVYSLSSSLVAMGFASRSWEVFRPFAFAVLPAVFILGVFTVARLVDTGIEYQQGLRGIARIRGYYRTLTPEAATYFSVETGRWPERRVEPRLWSGAFVALLTTAASMIAFTNIVVAGACVALLVVSLIGTDRIGLVHLYELVADEVGQVFFTMELVRGSDFRAYVQRPGARVSSTPSPRAGYAIPPRSDLRMPFRR